MNKAKDLSFTNDNIDKSLVIGAESKQSISPQKTNRGVISSEYASVREN